MKDTEPKNLITRKVRLFIDAPTDEQFIEEVKKWTAYQRIARRASNLVASHVFVQDNISDFFYLTEDFKVKLQDSKLVEDGVLNTSKTNTTYQLLSKHFKGEMPTAILTCINSAISKTYSKERIEVLKGDKSLRSYRNNIPLPIPSSEILRSLEPKDDNYTFTIFKTKFKTHFGRDRSGNKIHFDNIYQARKGYKLHDSSIVFDRDENNKLKIFLYVVFSFDRKPNYLNPDKEIVCRLDPLDIIVLDDKKKTKIGNTDDFLHGRMYIQKKLRELQEALKFTSGGKGRSSKLKALKRFEEKEHNFVETKLHTYSRQLIDYCLTNDIGRIVLANYETASDENKKTDKTLIRNWSYYGLSQKIIYKATMNNIKVIIPKNNKKEEIEID